MIKRSDLRTTRWGTAVLALTAALALTVSASAQTSKPDTNVAAGYSTIDLSIFAGWQWFQFGQGTHAGVHQFGGDGAWGERLTFDPYRYVSGEVGIQNAYNRLKLLPVGASDNNFTSQSAANVLLYGAGVLHLTPREARFRPFVLIGGGYLWYEPGNPAIPGVTHQQNGKPALVYGIGLKINQTPRWGVRFDLRGMRSGEPRFGLPGVPGPIGSYWLPNGPFHESSLTASVGVVFRLKYHEPPAPVAAAPPPPPPPPAPKANITISGVTGAQDVCAGTDVRLTVNASGWLPDQTPSYQWMVGGTAVPGATSASFNVPTTGAGNRSVTVKVSAGDSSATSNPVSVTVKPLTPPTIRFAVSPSTVAYGQTIALAATATGSECGGPATVRYSGEGVSGSTFDSRALNFDMSNRLKQQSRTVHITATATDTKNQTATAGADVTVTLSPEAVRQDILFPNRSARVNNAAKRFLLEVVAPEAKADPGAKVILIGHTDATEKRPAKLDEQRVLNSAAVLSAGKGVCSNLDLSQIMVSTAGASESPDAKPVFGDPSTKEQAGQAIKQSDNNAKFRRVEVWFVPSGAPMPAGLTGLKDAPAKEIRAKGCPK